MSVEPWWRYLRIHGFMQPLVMTDPSKGVEWRPDSTRTHVTGRPTLHPWISGR